MVCSLLYGHTVDSVYCLKTLLYFNTNYPINLFKLDTLHYNKDKKTNLYYTFKTLKYKHLKYWNSYV